MHVIIKAPKYPTLVFVYLFIFSITMITSDVKLFGSILLAV